MTSTVTDKSNFTSIPILNYALLSSPDTRAIFIQQLQHALFDVGFLYLEHTPVPDALFDEVIAYLPRVFALPQERKDALRMTYTPHFLLRICGCRASRSIYVFGDRLRCVCVFGFWFFEKECTANSSTTLSIHPSPTRSGCQ